MTRTLRPEFKDMQVCAICGAPAEIIGEPWTRDGRPDWWAKPIEINCSSHATGAQMRTKAVEGGGRRAKETTYYVRVFRHVCTRNSYEDAAGNRSDDPRLACACGALQDGLTRRATIDELPDLCFDDGSRERLVETDELESRWSA